MELGFALHPRWLDTSTREQFLAPLKAAGMTALEFTLHPGTEEWAPMQALAEECAQAGYPCHFHAPYQAPFTVAGFASSGRNAVEAMYAPALALVERLASECNLHPALVVHGATANKPRAELRKDTEAFLAWALAGTPRARLMLEILPPRPFFTRTGESREELLKVLAEMNDPRLGICWDLGHDYLLGYKELPGDEFLRVVRHVHIHDVDDAGEDHYPLIFGNVPWRPALRALARIGFQGAVIMEINGYRAQTIERLGERMAGSFRLMSETIKPDSRGN